MEERTPWKWLLAALTAIFLGAWLSFRWIYPEGWGNPWPSMERFWNVLNASFGVVEFATLLLIGGGTYFGPRCWRWLQPDVEKNAKKRRQQRRIATVVAMVLGTFLFLIVWLPSFQVASLEKIPNSTSGAELEDDYRKTWAGIFGGGILLAGVFVRLRRADAALDSARAADRTARAVEDGNITERFTRAIDQLGRLNDGDHTPHVVVRLGGIYALEQIARDAEEKFHGQIMEILTSYVRQNAPLESARERPAEDVQAAMTVILRNPALGRKQEPLDLSRTHLKNVQLRNAILRGANLTRANLQGVQFRSADLLAADLEHAILKNAHLRGADLTGADIRDADLSGALHLKRGAFCSARFDERTHLPNGDTGLGRGEVCDGKAPGGFADDPDAVDERDRPGYRPPTR